MPLPGLTFVSDGVWGTGQGSRLNAEQHDTNIYTLSEAIEALDEALAAGVTLAPPYVTGAGNIVTIHLSNATTINVAFDLPGLTYRGAWIPGFGYQINDIVTVSGSGVFLVLQSHTSAAEFDPEATDETTDQNPLYGLLLPEPSFNQVMRWVGDTFPAEQDLLANDCFKDATYGTFKVNIAHFSSSTFDPWAVSDDTDAEPLYTKIAGPAFPPVEDATVSTSDTYQVTKADTGKYLRFTESVSISFALDEYDAGTEVHFEQAVGCPILDFDDTGITLLPQRSGYDVASPFEGAVITAKYVDTDTWKLIGPHGANLTA